MDLVSEIESVDERYFGTLLLCARKRFGLELNTHTHTHERTHFLDHSHLNSD